MDAIAPGDLSPENASEYLYKKHPQTSLPPSVLGGQRLLFQHPTTECPSTLPRACAEGMLACPLPPFSFSLPLLRISGVSIATSNQDPSSGP